MTALFTVSAPLGKVGTHSPGISHVPRHNRHSLRRIGKDIQPSRRHSPSSFRVFTRSFHSSNDWAFENTLPQEVIMEPNRRRPKKLHPLLRYQKLMSANTKHIEKVWKAFVQVENAGLLAEIPTETLVAHGLTMWSAILRMPLRKLHEPDAGQYASRLSRILDTMEPRRPVSENDHIIYGMRCAVLLALHDFEALPIIAKRMRNRENSATDRLCITSITRAIQMLSRLRSPDEAILLALQFWNLISLHVYNIRRRIHNVDRPARLAGDKLRQSLFLLLDNVPNPSAWLINYTNDESQRIAASHLFLAYLCERERALDAFRIVAEMDRLEPSQSQTSPLPGLKPPQSQRSPLHDSMRLNVVKLLAQHEHYIKAEIIFTKNKKPSSDLAIYVPYLETGLYLAALQGQVQRCDEFFIKLSKFKEKASIGQQYMMLACAKAGDIIGITKLWDEINPPGSSTKPPYSHFQIMLYGYAEQNDVKNVDKWVGEIIRHGYHPDKGTFNNILKVFVMRGDIEAVSAILTHMESRKFRPDNITYTLVLSLLASRRDAQAAERVVKRIHHQNLEPDARTLNTLMDAHVESGSWAGVVRVFDYIEARRRKNGDTYSIDVFNILLKAFVRIGAPFPVVADYWQRLEAIGLKPTSYTWCLVIQSACDARRMDIAQDIFREMDRLSDETGSSSHINSYVLTIIMAGFLRIGDKVRAKNVYDEMLSRGLKPLSYTFGKIVRAYANEGTDESLQLAEDFLASIQKTMGASDVPWTLPQGNATMFETLYAPLMNAYGTLRRPKEVERLYNTMMENQGDTTVVFLTLLLDAYRKARNVDSVQEVWPKLFEHVLKETHANSLFSPREEVTPEAVRRVSHLHANRLCVPLSIYIDALSYAGLHTQIAEVWKQMRNAGFAFDPSNWNHLSAALVRAGEVERAFEVVERVLLPYDDRLKQARPERDRNPKDAFIFESDRGGPHDVERNFVDYSSVKTERRRRQRQSVATRMTKGTDALTMEIDRSLPASYSNPYETFSKSKKKAEDVEDVEDVDFARPLHMLQQMHPTWRIWKPHLSTLTHLGWALGILERGTLVRSRRGIEETPEAENTDSSNPEDSTSDENAEHIKAYQILIRIQERFPRTLDMVHHWYRSRVGIQNIRNLAEHLYHVR